MNKTQIDKDIILLDHGSGGKTAHSFLNEIIIPIFDNNTLSKLDDGAVIEICNYVIKDKMSNSQDCLKFAFSTDSYVVDPIFFPGGNIGDLAINGTVNDIAMCGADPKYISVALILEEGFLVDDLKIIIKTMADAAKKAGVIVVTGDTKVVPKGKADKIFINTSGFGVIPCGINISGSNAKAGDKVIISGTIADHGVTILSTREGLKFESDIKTDSAALNNLVKKIITSNNLDSSSVHVLRDPTRGGVGTTLNEIASKSGVRINIWEDALPIKNSVQGVCELLGFDPLYLANEGKLIAVVSSEYADRVLEIIKQDEYGKDAAIIGEVVHSYQSGVFLKTTVGGFRIVDMLTGEQLPRIC